jgi:hypothetical protein
MLALTRSRSQKLRDTNRRLHFLLDDLVASNGQPAVATPEHMAALLSELLGAGAELRAQPIPAKGDDPELDEELAQYRCNVERLRQLLPSIHSQLLVERARLEAQRAQVRSAAEWARASRQTL